MNINCTADGTRFSLKKAVILAFDTCFSNDRVCFVTTVEHNVQFFTGDVANIAENMAYRTGFNIVPYGFVSPGYARKVRKVFCNI